MKRILNKITRRDQKTPISQRITNETVAEHREKILAGGRRFKYPLQYSRHKLVINTIIISTLALIIAVALGWWQLYDRQNTGDFLYRVTKIVPVPVAKIDGKTVAYADYLVRYRSQLYYLQNVNTSNLGGEQNEAQKDRLKQQSMVEVLKATYAAKVAEEKNISLSDQEYTEAFDRLRKAAAGDQASVAVYNAVLRDYYNYSPAENEHILRQSLLKQKVAYAIDEEAKATADAIKEKLTKEQDLSKVATEAQNPNVIFQKTDWVSKTNQDGGLAKIAASLKKDEIAPVNTSNRGDGYYFVKLINSDNDRVQYEYIQVALTKFDDDFKKIFENNTEYYISINMKDALTK